MEALFFVTTRSKGFPKHGHPYDFWRFNCNDMEIIFNDFEILKLEDDPMCPGILLKARKPIKFKENDLSKHKVYDMKNYSPKDKYDKKVYRKEPSYDSIV